MSVLERTREIGILRCVGARARDVRRVFATEGLVLALAGWLLGIPFGYAIDRLFGWLVGRIFGFDMPVAFPPWNIAARAGRDDRARAGCSCACRCAAPCASAPGRRCAMPELGHA